MPPMPRRYHTLVEVGCNIPVVRGMHHPPCMGECNIPLQKGDEIPLPNGQGALSQWDFLLANATALALYKSKEKLSPVWSDWGEFSPYIWKCSFCIVSSCSFATCAPCGPPLPTTLVLSRAPPATVLQLQIQLQLQLQLQLQQRLRLHKKSPMISHTRTPGEVTH